MSAIARYLEELGSRERVRERENQGLRRANEVVSAASLSPLGSSTRDRAGCEGQRRLPGMHATNVQSRDAWYAQRGKEQPERETLLTRSLELAALRAHNRWLGTELESTAAARDQLGGGHLLRNPAQSSLRPIVWRVPGLDLNFRLLPCNWMLRSNRFAGSLRRAPGGSSHGPGLPDLRRYPSQWVVRDGWLSVVNQHQLPLLPLGSTH